MAEKLKLLRVDGTNLVFGRDGQEVTKSGKLSGLFDKCVKDDRQRQSTLMYTIMRRAIEADRDIAYEKHGDDWPNHCTITMDDMPEVFGAWQQD